MPAGSDCHGASMRAHLVARGAQEPAKVHMRWKKFGRSLESGPFGVEAPPPPFTV
jgi:hypothetical protein